LNQLAKLGGILMGTAAAAAGMAFLYLNSISTDQMILQSISGRGHAAMISMYTLYYIAPAVGAVGLLLLIIGIAQTSGRDLSNTQICGGKVRATKKCPYCAEEILIDAIKCRFCHAEFKQEDVQRGIELQREQEERLCEANRQEKQHVVALVSLVGCGCTALSLLYGLTNLVLSRQKISYWSLSVSGNGGGSTRTMSGVFHPAIDLIFSTAPYAISLLALALVLNKRTSSHRIALLITLSSVMALFPGMWRTVVVLSERFSWIEFYSSASQIIEISTLVVWVLLALVIFWISGIDKFSQLILRVGYLTKITGMLSAMVLWRLFASGVISFDMDVSILYADISLIKAFTGQAFGVCLCVFFLKDYLLHTGQKLRNRQPPGPVIAN